MKLLIAGGGTGGHINPAIAIANEFAKEYENSEILFTGTKKGMESDLVPKAGYQIEFIDVEGFLRMKSFYNFIVIGKFVKSIFKCMSIIKRFKPDIVVGTGGYVSAPVVLAAHLLKVPTLIHEQNAIAGKTTKMLSKYADVICTAFENTAISESKGKICVTGNPIRDSFSKVDKESSKREIGLDNGLPFVLCVSGSLGAQKISEYMTEYIKDNLDNIKYNMLIVTGDLYYYDVLDELKASGIDIKNKPVYIKNYLHDMEKYLSAADVVISRSGAISLSEIAYLGKPSILIPSPNVAENHQELNADRYVEKNASIKISEKDLTKDTLKNAIEGLIYDTKKLDEMSKNAKRMAVTDSAKLILNEIKGLM